jgi:hypothetical protein
MQCCLTVRCKIRYSRRASSSQCGRHWHDLIAPVVVPTALLSFSFSPSLTLQTTLPTHTHVFSELNPAKNKAGMVTRLIGLAFAPLHVQK